ncbi:hypothetical protein ONS95_000834 [Cadophora gregata]|uniref:uncharacterized protein n=1 Tax=Cadophora gregata TaxID=51156 RepID=UPI0026DD4BC2|nr:uncharacterized protein ONS95_000834 [Cadophora gregata]KAK0128888.1 hypothetical protein ONS95_000834 [Cadophora gregata]
MILQEALARDVFVGGRGRERYSQSIYDVSKERSPTQNNGGVSRHLLPPNDEEHNDRILSLTALAFTFSTSPNYCLLAADTL